MVDSPARPSVTAVESCCSSTLLRCWRTADAARAVPVLLHYTSPLISPGHVRIWMMPSDSTAPRAAPTYYQLNTWKQRPLRETKATLINPRWAFRAGSWNGKTRRARGHDTCITHVGHADLKTKVVPLIFSPRVKLWLPALPMEFDQL